MSLFLLPPGVTSWELVDVDGPHLSMQTLISGSTRPVAAPVISTGQRPTSTETRNRA